MERNEPDPIAVGRALLSDPNWELKTEGRDSEPMEGFEAASPSELF
jgi:hypothetical protein